MIEWKLGEMLRNERRGMLRSEGNDGREVRGN